MNKKRIIYVANVFSSEFKFLPCIQISFLIMKQLNKNKF